VPRNNAVNIRVNQRLAPPDRGAGKPRTGERKGRNSGAKTDNRGATGWTRRRRNTTARSLRSEATGCRIRCEFGNFFVERDGEGRFSFVGIGSRHAASQGVSLCERVKKRLAHAPSRGPADRFRRAGQVAGGLAATEEEIEHAERTEARWLFLSHRASGASFFSCKPQLAQRPPQRQPQSCRRVEEHYNETFSCSKILNPEHGLCCAEQCVHCESA
jgi:hypothetical protein